jgi:hypothetical protein
MPEMKAMFCFPVKNEVLRLKNINGNFTTNNAREIFARVLTKRRTKKRTKTPGQLLVTVGDMQNG